MKDRVAGAPGQYKATVTGAELNKLQNGEPFAITLQRDDKPEVEGTPYSKAAVLPDHVARKVCPIKGDPTPADAFDSLASEVGNKAEVFGFELPVPAYDAKTGRYDYQFTLGDYPRMQGRTVTVRTYMYGDMAISGDGGVFDGCTNENANIEQNPESGICEFTDIIPSFEDDEFVDELGFSVPFCENPFLEKPVIFETRGSIWQEIKRLFAIESLSYPGCYYHVVDGEKEWINPPMGYGEEYRTTERYNGDVKYKRLVYFGEFPNNANKEVSTGIDANKYSIIGVHRHAKEIGVNADLLYLAKVTYEYIYVNDGVYNIHVSTSGEQHVTAEYVVEYVEV